MEEVNKMLTAPGIGNLATVDNGRPRVRPFAFMFVEDGRFYFCTSSNKQVYRQLSECPFIEYTKTSEDMHWLRISGEIRFDENIRHKEKSFSIYPMLSDIYHSPDNPIFKVFYLEHGMASIDSMTAEPCKVFDF